MIFEEFLSQKKINSAAFLASEPERWQEWKNIFEQVHPESFTMQMKFLLNPTRRKYPLLAKSVSQL
jgi:hypothetical protein